MIYDQLDEKRKVIFSSHLKNYDQNPPVIADQGEIRQTIAMHAEAFFTKKDVEPESLIAQESKSINEKSA